MVGAPLLTGKAALRVGAGLVTIVSDNETANKLDERVEEIMTLALPEYEKTKELTDRLLTFIQARKVTAVVIGPGLGREAASPVRLLAARLQLPLVLDGGGLAAFREHLALLQELTKTNQQVILTPHSGEFSNLANGAKPDAARFAKGYNVTLVAKGHHTRVFHPDGSVWANATGNPGLATSGTGDVLAGVIAGLLAQGMTCAEAAETGVYVHGLAGDLAAHAKTEPGLIASDVIEFLPEALKRLDQHHN